MQFNWWGKIVGVAVGLLLGKWLGGLVGLVIGHQFDRGFAGRAKAEDASARSRVQRDFFTTTFAVMGHLAKADGRVSEEEVRAARSVMHRMSLSPERVQMAIRLFNDGKAAEFDLERALAPLASVGPRRPDLLRAFVEVQIEAALADGQIHEEQRRVLWRIANTLGISRVELAQLEAIVRAEHHTPNKPRHPGDRLLEAYRVLGVKRDAPDATVKQAYRRLMNQHHPDKLVSKGLPEDMMVLAREKTREIRAAYERVREARGMR